MSKHETWRTRRYAQKVGGLLIEEFRAIKRNSRSGHRDIDGILVLGEPNGIQRAGEFDFEGREIIVIQTKKDRLGMYLMGQAFFSAKIMEQYKPLSIKPVAICGRGDEEMEAICRAHDIEVVVIPDEPGSAERN